jgi:hypothetical protein
VSGHAGVGAVCIANIGRKERRKRMTVGLIGLALGVGGASVLAGWGAALPWRLLLFVPFWLGAIGVFQALDRTCVGLSSRGQRDMDDGPAAITDASELAQVRRQARQVYLKSWGLALVMVALTLAVPHG